MHVVNRCTDDNVQTAHICKEAKSAQKADSHRRQSRIETTGVHRPHVYRRKSCRERRFTEEKGTKRIRGQRGHRCPREHSCTEDIGVLKTRYTEDTNAHKPQVHRDQRCTENTSTKRTQVHRGHRYTADIGAKITQKKRKTQIKEATGSQRLNERREHMCLEAMSAQNTQMQRGQGCSEDKDA